MRLMGLMRVNNEWALVVGGIWLRGNRMLRIVRSSSSMDGMDGMLLLVVWRVPGWGSVVRLIIVVWGHVLGVVLWLIHGVRPHGRVHVLVLRIMAPTGRRRLHGQLMLPVGMVVLLHDEDGFKASFAGTWLWKADRASGQVRRWKGSRNGRRRQSIRNQRQAMLDEGRTIAQGDEDVMLAGMVDEVERWRC